MLSKFKKIIESNAFSTLTEESGEKLERETIVLFDQTLHVLLDPILDECLSTLTLKSQINKGINYICFKPNAYGKRHSIMGTVGEVKNRG